MSRRLASQRILKRHADVAKTIIGAHTSAAGTNLDLPGAGFGPQSGIMGMAANPSPFEEVGITGLRRVSGYVQEEFIPDLRGPKGMQVFREMADNSAIVGACLTAFEMPIRQTDWRIEPGDSPDAQLQADFIDACFDDMSHTADDLISEALTMLRFGHAMCETVYKTRGGDVADPIYRSAFDDGLIGLRKCRLRAQETLFKWDFDDDGGLRGMFQLSPPDYRLRFIPMEKAVLFRTRADKNNPEGRSVMRNAYFSWYFTKRLMETEAIGLSRDMTGLPIMEVPAELLLPNPPTEAVAQLAVCRQIVRDIKVDENMGLLVPQRYDEKDRPLYNLKLLASPGTRQHDTVAILTRYAQQIAQSMLADFLMIGHSSVGSRALADPKIQFFMLAVNAVLDQIASPVNRYLIPRLLKLNGFTYAYPPEWIHGQASAPDYKQMGDYIKSLTDAGAPLFPDQVLQNHLLDIANLPHQEPLQVAGGGSDVYGPDPSDLQQPSQQTTPPSQQAGQQPGQGAPAGAAGSGPSGQPGKAPGGQAQQTAPRGGRIALPRRRRLKLPKRPKLSSASFTDGAARRIADLRKVFARRIR